MNYDCGGYFLISFSMRLGDVDKDPSLIVRSRVHSWSSEDMMIKNDYYCWLVGSYDRGYHGSIG